MLGDHEYVRDSLLHCNRDDLALVLFQYHLVESLNVDAVELFLHQRNCHWCSDIQGLLLSEAEIPILSCVFSTDSNSVISGIILIAFHLEGDIKSFILCFNEPSTLLLDSPATDPSDVVVQGHQVVKVPNVI